MDSPETRVSSLFVVPLIRWIVGVLLFVALLNRQRDLTVLTLMILGIMAVSRLWCRLSLIRVQIKGRVERTRVFPDEGLRFFVHAENRKWLPVRLQVDVKSPRPPFFDEAVISDACGLLWYQKVDFEWELTARQRGVYRLGPIHMEAGDFFGFFSRRKREKKDPVSVLVYPRLIPIREISLPRKDFFGVPGAKSPVQDPIYIMGTRDYQHWQPARNIHWKASARHNRLQEKVFEPSEQEKILIMVDVEPYIKNSARDVFERTLEAVASLAVQLDQKGYALGFLTNARVEEGPFFLPVSRGPERLSSILEILARIHMESSRAITDIFLNGLSFPWGLSGICFSHEAGPTLRVLETFFQLRRVPMAFVLGASHLNAEKASFGLKSRIFRLDQICVETAGES